MSKIVYIERYIFFLLPHTLKVNELPKHGGTVEFASYNNQRGIINGVMGGIKFGQKSSGGGMPAINEVATGDSYRSFYFEFGNNESLFIVK